MSENGKTFRIVKLQAENFKKLKAIEISPIGNAVIISGRNEQGKTSVLDAIWSALEYSQASKNIKEPIRKGEKKASVVLDLGNIIVKRTWTGNDKSYLAVENKEGAAFKSPQSILDALIGKLSFDPLAFAGMADKAQREILLSLVDIGIDLNKWEIDRKAKYDERTGINRKINELEGQTKGFLATPETTPEEEIPASIILKEQQKAQEVLIENAAKREALRLTNSRYNNIKKEIEYIEKQLQELIKEQRENTKEMGRLQTIVETLVDPDISIFEARLSEIDEINKNVRLKKQTLSLKGKLEEEKSKSDTLTLDIETLDKDKENALKSCKFPIEGLAFNDGGVTYRDIPFGQCSASERLRVSLAMAMAMNPKLKVIRIMDGSLLDSEHMKIIQDMCKEKDYQAWIEVVDETGKVGIYIEDGEVKNI